MLVLLAACSLWPSAQAFDLQGHRGGRGLLPENTLAAFENALALGVTTLELDIGITADGVAVVHHDAALNPATTRDAQGRWLKERGPLLRALTLSQLQAYDVGRIDPASSYAREFPQQQPRDGQRIPTLAAVLQLVKDRGADSVRFDIETKVFPQWPDATATPEVFVDTLLRTLREAGMQDRVMVQSFDWRTLKLLQQRAPGMPTMYLTLETARANRVRDPAWTAGMLWRDHASTAHMVKAAGGTIWAPNFDSIDAAAVKAGQALGLQVIPWTVNDTADMERLIQWGVDGLISDYPDRLRAALQRTGKPLPAAFPAR